jgi:hypothetical protein
LTWKAQDMPSGPPICALRASARRISGSGCTGWATPRTTNIENASNLEQRKKKGGCCNLAEQGHELTGWDTPRASDHKGFVTKGRGGSNLMSQSQLAGWPTPTICCDEPLEKWKVRQNLKKHQGINLHMSLNIASQLAGWPTSSARDAKGGYEGGRIRNGTISTDTLDVTAQLAAHGATATGIPAATARQEGFRLNPRFSLWLMGYPTPWASCGERAMQSCRRPRRSL